MSPKMNTNNLNLDILKPNPPKAQHVENSNENSKI